MKRTAKIVCVMCITVVLALSLVGAAVANSNKADPKDIQDKVHEIAEIARSIGLPEDDPIIKRASEIWWEQQDIITSQPKMTYMGAYWITGYDPFCSHCCGKSDGITASGAKAEFGVTCAMYGIPFGTKIYIDGLGYYIVQDRGVGSGCIDLACENHAACYAVTGRYDVYIVE